MVLSETLHRVKEYNWNLDEMLASMLEDEKKIVHTLKESSLTLPHQVLDMLSVDIRSLHKVTEETDRNISNVQIQEVLSFIDPKIEPFKEKMDKMVQLMSKLEDVEDESETSEDRFIGKTTAKSMNRL